MRVALIALHFSEYAARLALALAAEGHAVQLHLSERNAGRELDEALAARLSAAVDVRRHPHPSRRHALRHALRIASQLRRFRPDVIHAQEAAPWTTALALAFAGRGAKVLTVHDPLPHSGADINVRRRSGWAGTQVRRLADAIIVHGPRAVADMEAAAPEVAGRIYPVMHGILGDPPRAPVEREANSFLFFGRIEAYKGLGVLLEAAHLLGSRDYRLIIAGNGHDLDRHRAQIVGMPQVVLDDRFIPADEVPGLFAAATAAVMPYLDATQSGVAALAFAAGAPVIASRVGALPDVVCDGVNGLLMPPGDAPALAAAMARLLDDPAFAASLSRGAAETARTTLSWDSIAAATLAVYEAARGTNRKLLI